MRRLLLALAFAMGLPIAAIAQTSTSPPLTIVLPASGGGGGTGCVPAGGQATNIVLYGALGVCTPALDANVSGGGLTLGLANSVGGSLVLEGSTSGAATLTGGTSGVFVSASAWALSGVVTLTGVSNALGMPLTLDLTHAVNLPNTGLATQTANTVMGALTATTPSGLALPSCVDSSGNHLNYTLGTGFSCGTTSSGTGLTVNSTTISGGGSGHLLYDDGTKLQEIAYGLTGNSVILQLTSAGLITASDLPLATTSTLGGVIVGTGLSVTAGTVTPTFGTAANQVAQGGVITGAGPTGSTTVTPVITYNAAGQLTTVTSATITPAIGSVTGLGTNIATMLGVAVGTAGAPVVLNGAGGTPSALVCTNCTGVPNAAVAATPLATGTSVSLTAPREYYVCTSTCNITPPVPAAGYEFCLMNDDNVSTKITLVALGSSASYEVTARTSYGTAGTGTAVSGGAIGDKICIVGRDSTHYLTTSYTGSWTIN